MLKKFMRPGTIDSAWKLPYNLHCLDTFTRYCICFKLIYILCI